MLGVIVNPNAAFVRRNPALVGRLRELVGEDGEVVATRSAAELRGVIARFCDAGVDPLAICGGDGTYGPMIGELTARLGASPLPRLAILRGGTVNTVAGNLGIHGRPDDLVAAIVGQLRSGAALREVAVDILSANGRYGFLWAAAMGARFLEAYYGGAVRGVAAATVLAVRTVASSLVAGPWARRLFEPVELELHVDGERVALERARLLVAATIPDVGLGMRVAWQAGGTPGRFHLIASAISTTSMALQVPRVLAGRPLQGAPHIDRLARSALLRFREPHGYTLDGELFHEETVTLAIGPRIRVLVPARGVHPT